MLGMQKEENGPVRDPGADQFAQAQGSCSESLKELMQQHGRLVQLVVQRQWLLIYPMKKRSKPGAVDCGWPL